MGDFVARSIAIKSLHNNGDMKKDVYDTDNDGVVDKAEKLATPITISFTGDVSGSVSTDGSSDKTVNLTLPTVTTAGTNPKVTYDAKGRVTGGGALTASDIPNLTLSKITDAGTAASKNIGTAAGNVPVIGADGFLDPSIYHSGSETILLGAYYDLKQYGKAAGNGTTDDTQAFVNAIAGMPTTGAVLFLPAGTYRITSPIIISRALKIKGEGAKILADGYFKAIDVRASSFEMEGVIVECKTRDHTKTTSYGLYISSDNGDGTFNYLNNIGLKNCEFHNFTTSIALESCYWLKFDGVHTYQDKFGITSNILTNATDQNANPTTTFVWERCYLHGSDGGTNETGSLGFNIKNAVTMVMRDSTIEWYDQIGAINTVQTLSVSDCYFERANSGVEMINVTGSALFNNCYSNLVSQWAYRISYGTFVFNGGRVVSDGTGYFLDKLWNSTYIEIAPIGATAVAGYITDSMTGAGWDKQQVNKIGIPYSASAMPTSGTYIKGDYVKNTAPVIAGTSGSKYVIKGWIRLTTGSNHVLNTDWSEDRALTGT